MISSLNLNNFRGFKSLELDFACARGGSDTPARLVVFFGGNAQGKTTLLEALHILLTGRSFRTTLIDQLIGPHGSGFLVRGAVVSSDEGVLTSRAIGIEKSRKFKLRASVDAAAIKSSMTLARMNPVQLIDHQSFQLILGEPSVRRRFLDWGAFHVEPGYGTLLKDWQNALTQRNACLKSFRKGIDDERALAAWSDAYASLSVQVARVRDRYFHGLMNFMRGRGEAAATSLFASRILLAENLEVRIKHGFSFDPTQLDSELVTAFKAELSIKHDYEIALGRTFAGPHKADLLINADKQSARDVLSRGQCKLAAASLLLGQVLEMRDVHGERTVVLFDDLSAELDDQRAAELLIELRAGSSQLFVTSLGEDLSELPDILRSHAMDGEVAMFQIDHKAACRVGIPA